MKKNILKSITLLFVAVLVSSCANKRPRIYSYTNSLEPITLYGRDIKLDYNDKDYQKAVYFCDGLLTSINGEKETYKALSKKLDRYYDFVDKYYVEYQKASLIADMTAADNDYLLSDTIYDAYDNLDSYDIKYDLAFYDSKYKYDYYSDMSDAEIDEYIQSLDEEAETALSEAKSNQKKVITDYFLGNIDEYEAAKRYMSYGQEIATLTDYDNYLEYSYDRIFERDYSPEDTIPFKGYVKEYIAPLFNKTDDYILDFKANASEQELTLYNNYAKGCFAYYLNNIESFAKELGGAYYSNFNYLLKSGNYFLSALNENITAYQWNIDGEPYMFFGKNYQDMRTFVHEFGHYNAGRCSDEDVSYDLLETHSQSSETLYYIYLYKHAFDCPAYLINRVHIFLTSIVLGCLLNEFEMYLYTNENTPNMSKEEMQTYWNGLVSDLGVEVINSIYDFDRILYLLFDYSVYYISYSTSAVASLEMMSIAFNDYANAKTIYEKIYADYSDNPDVSNFQQVISYAGLSSVFEEETYPKITSFYNQFFNTLVNN